MKRTRRTAQHHIFEECAKYTSDVFWKDVLISCSRNKFPSGFMYKDGFLAHKGKKAGKIYLSADPKEALVEIITFFQEKNQIYSNKDKEKEEEELLQEQVIIKEIKSWDQLKKKKKQLDIVLAQFILDVCKKYGKETRRDKDNLVTLINIAILQGYLTNETVVIEDNQIVDIVGLEIKNGDFYLPVINQRIRPVKSTSRRKEVSNKTKSDVNFYLMWLEFLKYYFAK
jgi:Holliday junction resolvase RusA-like endonuclease